MFTSYKTLNLQRIAVTQVTVKRGYWKNVSVIWFLFWRYSFGPYTLTFCLMGFRDFRNENVNFYLYYNYEIKKIKFYIRTASFITHYSEILSKKISVRGLWNILNSVCHMSEKIPHLAIYENCQNCHRQDETSMSSATSESLPGFCFVRNFKLTLITLFCLYMLISI